MGTQPNVLSGRGQLSWESLNAQTVHLCAHSY
jgi:hypothetical protein